MHPAPRSRIKADQQILSPNYAEYYYNKLARLYYDLDPVREELVVIRDELQDMKLNRSDNPEDKKVFDLVQNTLTYLTDASTRGFWNAVNVLAQIVNEQKSSRSIRTTSKARSDDAPLWPEAQKDMESFIDYAKSLEPRLIKNLDVYREVLAQEKSAKQAGDKREANKLGRQLEDITMKLLSPIYGEYTERAAELYKTWGLGVNSCYQWAKMVYDDKTSLSPDNFWMRWQVWGKNVREMLNDNTISIITTIYDTKQPLAITGGTAGEDLWDEGDASEAVGKGLIEKTGKFEFDRTFYRLTPRGENMAYALYIVL